MIRFDFSNLIAATERRQENIDSFFEGADLSTFIEQVLAESFEDVWSSEGQAIGEDWNGRTLVQTGRLRDSLTSPVVLRINGGWRVETRVPYASFVEDRYRFMALTDEAAQRIAQYVAENLLGDG
jgi:phage gpG-like protein